MNITEWPCHSVIFTTDLLIRVENKNSLIRKGITIVSPVYNPGHKTPIYIRVVSIPILEDHSLR